MVTFDSRDPGTTRAEWARDERWAILPQLDLDGVTRVIVLAAHPDDETLGAGGLMAEAFSRGVAVSVVVVTNGDASHPGSPTLGPTELASLRSAEVRSALELLAPGTPLVELGLGDGTLASIAPELQSRLAEAVGQAAQTASRTPVEGVRPDAAAAAPPQGAGRTLLVAPWRGDGHPDHRAVGDAAAWLADRFGFELLEYPVWLWHWSRPDDSATPWADFVSLPLSEWSAVSKDQAISAHRTQVEALSAAPGDEALLHATFLANFDRDDEIFVRSAPAGNGVAGGAPAEQGTAGHPASTTAPDARPRTLPAEYFENTYARADDPWGFVNRWYESRKRAVTVSALPRQHYASGFEIGCSIGVLTEQLAARCDTLLAVDIAPAAIERARQRLARATNVTLRVADVSQSAVEGSFDLVVLSEVGYYFDAAVLDAVLAKIDAALAADGQFVACHWRHEVGDYLQTGDEVHERIAAFAGAARWNRLARHLEDDFVLEVYSRDPRSVAAETGLL
ncbi:bifunctional PIG-L family deacetylase/class I SAM-dependent methyltransferase [Subtercola sp. YIM 133946]|uniref:bifunctional PIG-L family deacetylase/class I SAM-dependent methyltransferase n=1 Tax=Subtercola sp. YIM 133946 TaxID=3118909 RepID=UPI002F95520B